MCGSKDVVFNSLENSKIMKLKDLSFVEPIDEKSKTIEGGGLGMFVAGAVGAWAIDKGLDYVVDQAPGAIEHTHHEIESFKKDFQDGTELYKRAAINTFEAIQTPEFWY